MPRVLVIQPDPDAPPAGLGRALLAAGLEPDVRVPLAGDEVPSTPAGYAAVAVLGGFMGAYEDERYPWLDDVKELIAVSERAQVEVLGLCLGAQLAADALGGRAHRGAHGYQIGWLPTEPTSDGRRDPVVNAVAEGTPMLLWHQDTWELPPGAVRVLEPQGAYREQGFRRGTVLALQPHPEADRDVIARWCADPTSQEGFLQAAVDPADLLDPADELVPAAEAVLGAWARGVAALRPRARVA